MWFAFIINSKSMHHLKVCGHCHRETVSNFVQRFTHSDKDGRREYILWLCLISPIRGHLSEYASTPSNKIDQFCVMAQTCIHDTIPICGKMGEEKRTFMDFCDMLEFACDTNQIYVHVDDMEGCP